MGKADKTRQYIIEQTAPVFNRKGFAGTSMSDITKVTGLTKGSIYGNFRNKDEVALAALDHNLQQVEKGIIAALKKEKTMLGKLQAYVKYYRSTYREQILAFGCPIANIAPEADDTHPELRTRVNQAISYLHKSICRLVEKGIESKEINPAVVPAVFSARMISLIEGGIMLTKSTGDLLFFHEAINLVEALIQEVSLLE